MPGVEKTLHEYKHGKLHSGSKHGPVVHSRKQAIAIALSQERKEHKKHNQDRHARLHEDGSVRVSHNMVNGCEGHLCVPVAKRDATATASKRAPDYPEKAAAYDTKRREYMNRMSGYSGPIAMGMVYDEPAMSALSAKRKANQPYQMKGPK